MRLVLNVGGQAGLTGTILYYRYSLDGGTTWYDTDAAIQLDGSANQTFWGNWQPLPPRCGRASIRRWRCSAAMGTAAR